HGKRHQADQRFTIPKVQFKRQFALQPRRVHFVMDEQRPLPMRQEQWLAAYGNQSCPAFVAQPLRAIFRRRYGTRVHWSSCPLKVLNYQASFFSFRTGGELRETAFFRILEKLNMLKKCIPPRTSITTPSFVEIYSTP